MASHEIRRPAAKAMRAQLWAIAMVLTVLAMVAAKWPTEIQSAASIQTPANSSPNQPPKGPKRLHRNPSRPILSQLREEDLSVEVLGADDPGLQVTNLPGGALAFLTRNVDLVATITITEITPHFVENGSWIESTATAAVTDVLKSTAAAAPWPIGVSIDFKYNGGTIVVGKRTIVGKSEWMKPLVVGNEYLMFARVVGSNLNVEMNNLYDVSSGVAVAHRLDFSWSNDIHGQSIGDLKTRVRAISRQ